MCDECPPLVTHLVLEVVTQSLPQGPVRRLSNIKPTKTFRLRLPPVTASTGGPEMADKPQTHTPKTSSSADPFSTMTQLQKAGFGNMMGMGTAWVEAVSDMSAEVADFMAERLKEDVKVQHEILHCKNVANLQHIRAQFVQKAIDQYQAETSKLVEMGTNAFKLPDGPYRT
eukprot:GHVR01057013.1.p1 GENE.GHVR01057013.1~~GHVR01057013.1.p1  ORF type:complete len:171 (+),score=10.45 GHVR01057013.1:238-750(+)